MERTAFCPCDPAPHDVFPICGMKCEFPDAVPLRLRPPRRLHFIDAAQ